MISLRHVSRVLIRRVFERESLMMDVYNWVDSSSPKPKYFELRNLPNYVVPNTETVEHCKDVFHMYEIDAPVESLEDRDFSRNDTSVIWAGEAGADGGGLYREFLLYCMEIILFAWVKRILCCLIVSPNM